MDRAIGGAESAPGRKQELALNEMIASLGADVIAFKMTVETMMELASRPEIQATDLAQILDHICDSLGEIILFEATADKVAAAFAAPGRRATNRLNAGKLRSGHVPEARELFDKWAKNIDLYPNMASFIRDVQEKRYCTDAGTARKWLRSFAAPLPSDHPLRTKLGKK